MELYEQIVEILLAQASVGATTLTSVVGQVAAEAGNRDDTALVGAIERERERALSRYRRDRDTGALDLAMRELDRQEADERRVRSEEAVPAHVAVTYLRELPETWRQAGGGHGRRLLASALFERIEVLGLREATFYPTAEAARHGLAASIPTEIGISVSGRGERI